MKFTPLLTKIAASLAIAAKAVNGQCENMPDSIANLPPLLVGIKQLYCSLSGNEAYLLQMLVEAAVKADPTYAFFGECLTDLDDAIRYSQYETAYKKALGPCKEDDREGTAYSRLECEDNKTKVSTFTRLTSHNRTTVNPWNMYMCKKETCNTDTLNQVLNTVYLDLYEAGGDNGWRQANFMPIATYTPTVECYYDQISKPMRDTELYCSGESAPACDNTKLIEVKLGDDAPFEIAICDDNDCLDSLGEAFTLSIVADGFGSNPFCLPEETFPRDITDVIITYSEKAFNSSDYCSVAAASGRTGRCKTPKAGKAGKATKFPKAPKLPKECKKSKAPKAPKISKESKATKAPKISKVRRGLRA